MFPKKAYLILETGEVFSGLLANTSRILNHKKGSLDVAGEVVFNTSHTGYEEIASDPSYFSQIVVMTAPMQGNYGAFEGFKESKNFWIKGFICLELNDFCFKQENVLESEKVLGSLGQKDPSQFKNFPSYQEAPNLEGNSFRSWLDQLVRHGVPALKAVDTRSVVLRLRNKGVALGAIVEEENLKKAFLRAKDLIKGFKKEELDWAYRVSTRNLEVFKGDSPKGPRVAVLDFGCKKNILRELKKHVDEIALFPCRSSVEDIKKYNPHGILLSNGPGDPRDVKGALETVKALLRWRFIFGICMGHQILGMALGGKIYKLFFGHRGSNHPVKNLFNQKIYVTSQNHGYTLQEKGLPSSVKISHVNMNDGSVAGFYCEEEKCMGIQFHPESAPGTHDAKGLFKEFINKISYDFKEFKQILSESSEERASETATQLMNSLGK